MKEHFRCSMKPVPNPANVIQGEQYRITLITDRLVRFEYESQGRFVDDATQTVWYRDLGMVPFERREKNGRLLSILDWKKEKSLENGTCCYLSL